MARLMDDVRPRGRDTMKWFRTLYFVVLLSLVGCASLEKKPAGLVLWNTLDSERAVRESRSGLGGMFKSGRFVEGAFGSAVQLEHNAYETVTFPFEVFPSDAGCIEFLAMLKDFPTQLRSGQRPALIQVYDGKSAYGIHFNANDGHANGGLCGWAGKGGHCGTARNGTWTYKAILGEVNPEGWHHYAIVWDKEGLKDLPSGQQYAVYLDGELNTGHWRGDGKIQFESVGNAVLRLNVKHTPVGQGTIAFNELKVWNYAKTDFGD